MIDANLINHIMRSVDSSNEDNTLVTIDTKISYGTIIINDEYCMYIKATCLELGELLVDVAMPIEAFDKCRNDIRQHIEDLLLKPVKSS